MIAESPQLLHRSSNMISRPSLVQGTKKTFGLRSRALMRSYSCLRCSTCHRGNPSSIFPYGRLFWSITATRTPRSARISAATEPEMAPPMIATKCCPFLDMDSVGTFDLGFETRILYIGPAHFQRPNRGRRRRLDALVQWA